MEQAVLTPDQEKVLEAFGKEPRLAGFYLSGGTALAGFYLNHRLSDDLDFFIYDEPDLVFLHEFANQLKAILGANNVRYEKLYDRHQFYFLHSETELKVEFTRYHFPQLAPPMARNGLKIDSLRDIAANKIMALLDRFDPKDFVDLFFILKTNKLEGLRQDAEKKFGIEISGLFLGGEMAKVRRIEALPKMTKPLEVKELKDFFTAQAKLFYPEILF